VIISPCDTHTASLALDFSSPLVILLSRSAASPAATTTSVEARARIFGGRRDLWEVCVTADRRRQRERQEDFSGRNGSVAAAAGKSLLNRPKKRKEPITSEGVRRTLSQVSRGHAG